jgi:hypothetical protein
MPADSKLEREREREKTGKKAAAYSFLRITDISLFCMPRGEFALTGSDAFIPLSPPTRSLAGPALPNCHHSSVRQVVRPEIPVFLQVSWIRSPWHFLAWSSHPLGNREGNNREIDRARGPRVIV